MRDGHVALHPLASRGLFLKVVDPPVDFICCIANCVFDALHRTGYVVDGGRRGQDRDLGSSRVVEC